MKKVKPKKIGKLSVFRKLIRYMPNHCSYCGQRYIGCHSDHVNILYPMPENGKYCPNGHEGYVKSFYGHGYIKHTFDYIKK